MALQFAFSLLRKAPSLSSSSLAKYSSLANFLIRSKCNTENSGVVQCGLFFAFRPRNPSWVYRNLSYGSVNLVVSEGKTKFESHEGEPPKKDKWKNKKRFKLQKKREKDKRKAANKRDPRWLGGKGKKKKQKFANAEERINSKLDKARIKESMLIERLKRYEVPKVQGPQVEPHNLTGEELFYLKKMGQKRSNYAPVGRRGIFGGVILNMHMHWKKHETVKVICKPCKPGQVREYAEEIARLSGGIPVQIIGDNTIIFYRGKNYVQPEVMSPTDTLSKKRALEKSKYEQSLESVRRFIAIAEKELELYYRHIALYGEPNKRSPLSILNSSNIDEKDARNVEIGKKECHSYNDGLSAQNNKEPDSGDEMSEIEDNFGDEVVSLSESDAEDDCLSSLSESDAEDDSLPYSDMEQTRSSSYTEDAKEIESSLSV